MSTLDTNVNADVSLVHMQQLHAWKYGGDVAARAGHNKKEAHPSPGSDYH